MVLNLSLKHKIILYILLSRGNRSTLGSLVAAELRQPLLVISQSYQFVRQLLHSRRQCLQFMQMIQKHVDFTALFSAARSCCSWTRPAMTHDDIDGEYVFIDYANNNKRIACLE